MNYKSMLCCANSLRLVSLLLLFIFGVIDLTAQGIEGNIINSKGEPIPYSSIYIPSLHKGTTANEEGVFHMALEPGEYELIIQYLGYKTQVFNIKIENEYLNVEVTLEHQNYLLPEVIITSTGEDPAYYIMRKAIGMSQYYRNQVSEYTARVYLKGTGIPEKIPALMRKQLKNDGIEVGKYIVNETLSEIHYKKGEPIQTKVISMRSSEFGNETSPMQFVTLSLYDDIDGIISPLSRAAFQVYQFMLEGTFIEDGRTINKIKVIPRRKGHDLYQGTIYIREGSWNLHSVDLKVEQRMLQVHIRQVFQAVDPLVWMPVSHDYNIQLSLLGAAFTFKYLATVNDYHIILDEDIDHDFYSKMIEDDYFDLEPMPDPVPDTVDIVTVVPRSEEQQRVETLLKKEDLSNREMRELNRLVRKEATLERERPPLEIKSRNTEIADSALIRPTEYWNQQRPIPLTANEMKSFNEPINDTANNDTVTHRRSILGEVILGTSGKKIREYWRMEHNGLLGLSSFSYNTVDGLLVNKKAGFTYIPETGKRLNLNVKLNYAFARQRFTYEAGLRYLYHPRKRAGIGFSGGRITSDFNENTGINPLLNDFTSLFTRQNYLKLYEKDYIKIDHKLDVFNGLVLDLSFEYAQRRQLENHSNYYLTNFLGKSFTSNIPPPLDENSQLVEEHSATIFDASITYTPRHYYRIFNNQKQMLHSAYPSFTLRWRQGISSLFDSDAAFQMLEFGVKYGFEKRLLGRFDYLLKSGFFPKSNRLYFADYKHFNNNPLWVSGANKLDMFRSLSFYDYSTENPYFEAHIQYQHGRIVLKRLPFLAGSLIRESLFFNMLATEGNAPLLEFGYGVNQIFLLFDLELFTGIAGGKHHHTGIRLGIPLSGGEIRF